MKTARYQIMINEFHLNTYIIIHDSTIVFTLTPLNVDESVLPIVGYDVRGGGPLSHHWFNSNLTQVLIIMKTARYQIMINEFYLNTYIIICDSSIVFISTPHIVDESVLPSCLSPRAPPNWVDSSRVEIVGDRFQPIVGYDVHRTTLIHLCLWTLLGHSYI